MTLMLVSLLYTSDIPCSGASEARLSLLGIIHAVVHLPARRGPPLYRCSRWMRWRYVAVHFVLLCGPSSEAQRTFAPAVCCLQHAASGAEACDVVVRAGSH